MSGLSADLANNILDWLHGGTAYTPPATTYFALMTSMPSSSGGGTEVSGGSYGRVAVTNDAAHWPASVAQIKQNAVAINWGTATGPWGTVLGIAEYDAAAVGNLLTFYLFPTPVAIPSGSSFVIPVNGGEFTGWATVSPLSGASNYLANKINDWLHGGTTFVPPATTYFAIMTTQPTAGNTGGVEAAGTGYARVAFANTLAHWPIAVGQTKNNAAPIDWGTAAANWAPSPGATGIAEFDAAVAGNLLHWGLFSNGLQIITTGTPFQIPTNGAAITAQ